jgi:predicted Holliday junction resolvase-like endonuclease
MRPDPASVALGLAIGLLLAAIYLVWWRVRYTRAVRRDAVLRSEAVTTGKVSEQLLPFFPEFRFNPRDARFLGAPVDLVVFDGLAEGLVRRVVFVEVKTRGGRLSARERLVRDAVEAGRVEWMELRAGPAAGD